MRFFRQTLLSVCLIMPFAVWGQPVAIDDNANTNEDTSVSFNVLTNDTPGPGIDPATVDLDVSTTDVDNSFSTPNYQFTVDLLGEVTFVPALNFAGVATLYYTVQNADDDALTSNQALITVTVVQVNDLPVISSIVDQVIDEDTQTGVLPFTISDIETAADGLVVTAVSDNTALVPNLNILLGGSGAGRTIRVTPLPNQFGDATITITIDDGDDVVQTSFVVTVDPINDLPSITSITNQAIDVNTATALLPFNISDLETASSSLSVTGTSDNVLLVPDGNIQITGTGSARTVQVTPDTDEVGTATITLTVNDGTGTSQTTFQVTVNALTNSLPTITSISNQIIDEDTQTGVLNFTIGDAETAVGSLQVTATSDNTVLVPNTNIVIGGTGASRTVQVTPVGNQSGFANITLTVDDGDDVVQTVFQVTVNAINDFPTITSIAAQTIDEDTQTGVLAFTISDIETAAGALVVTAESDNTALVPNLNILLGGSGAGRTIRVTPLPNQFGDATITITVNDGDDVVQTSFVVTVDPINDLPSITSITNQVIDVNTATALLPFNVSDLETASSSLSVTGTSDNVLLVPDGNIQITGTGSARTVQVTPDTDEVGTATITLTVNDGTGTSQTTFQVTVNALTNSLPTITSISNQIIDEDTQTGVLNFTIGDAETAVGSLLVTATSDNIVLVPNINIVIGGTGASRTVQVTPGGNQSGFANITLSVNDGDDIVQTVFRVTVNAINDSPTISSIAAQSINEDSQTAAIPFVVGDPESAAGSLTVSGSSGNTALVPNANIVVSGSGANRSVTITPLPDQNGAATITLTVSDGTDNTQTAFQLTVNPVNDFPTIASIPDQTISENTQTGPLSFAIDDKETLATLLQLTPASSNTGLVQNSNIILGGSGSLRNVNVIPSINQIGTTTISLTVSDGLNTALTAFTVMVTNLDAPPTITPIADQVINEDSQTGLLPFTVGDPDTGPVGLLVTGASDNPALVPNGNIDLVEGVAGSWTVQIIPLANQSGVANITLTVTDGVETADISFSVTVNAVNDVPVFTKGANQTDNEDPGPQSIAGWATGISDGDPDFVQVLTFNVLNDENTLFSVQPSISAAGTLTYTPAPNANGVANVTVTLSDNGSGVLPNVNTSASQSFVITVNAVNDVPSFVKGGNETVNENGGAQTVTGWATAITDGDPEIVQALTFNVSNDNTTLFSVQPAISPGGNLTYTLAPGEFGLATVTVSLSDNGTGANTSANQTFTITVTSLNDAPIFTKGANQVVNEDAATQTIVGWATGISDGDPDLTQTLTFNVSNDDNTLFSIQPSITAAGTLTFTPAANANGSATVTVTLSDNGSGVLPIVNTSAAQVFTITINPITDVPSFVKGINQTVGENAGAQSIPGWATAISDGDPEVSQTLTFNVTNDNNALFSVQPTVTAAGTLSYTPASNLSGTAVVTISLSDNGSGVAPNVYTSASQTFNINVTQINDAPSFTKGANQSINEDAGAQSVAGWATNIDDGDPDLTQTLTFGVSNDNNTLFSVQPTISPAGLLSYTPAANANGTTTVTVILTDNGSGVLPNVNASPAETFTITIDPVNDAPTIAVIGNQTVNEDNATGNIAFTVGDLETPAASLVVTASSSNTTLVPNANITLGGTGSGRTINITPAANLSGVTTITVNVSDGVLTTPRTFTLTVNSINDATTISAITDQSTAEDTPTGAIAFTVGDVETAVGSLTVTPSSGNTTLIPIANIVIGGSGASRTVTITPANNQNGSTTITLSVDDGTTSTDTDFLITVTGVNDPPTISNITNRTINEDAQTGNINFTISDPESAATTLVVTGSSSNTTLVPDANITLGGTGTTRTVNVIPAANQFGVTTITLNVTDGTNISSETFTVTVNSVNDVPVITNQVTITVNEVQPVVLSLPQLTVVDPDNAYPAEFTLLVLGGENYTVTGLTTITPFPNFSGVLSVPVFVSDGAAFSPIFYLQITVNSTNDVPVITGQSTLTINEDQTIMLQLTDLTVTDPDNTYPADFTLTVLAGPNYTFSTNTVTPAANYNGTLSVSVKVNDGTVDSAPYNVQVTITPVNDPPVITAQSPLATNEDIPLTLVIGNFTVTDPEPTTYTLSVSQTPGPNYTVSGNTITPDANYSGTLTVPVTASDGVLNSVVFNAQIHVNAVNDAPVITGQNPLTTVEETSLTLLLANLTVTDVDNTFPTGFSMTVQSGTNYTFSGNTVTPVLDFVGDLFVNVIVSDGTTNSAPALILVTVTPASDAPIITGQNPLSTNEDQSLQIVIGNLIVEDPDTPPAQRTLSVIGGTNYTFDGNTITPSANFFGTLTVNVRVFDGEAYSNTFPLQVTVNSVNDRPLFNAISNITILEDAALQSVTITGISAGPLETQTMVLLIQSSNTALIPQPSVTPAYNGTAATATFTFKPEPNMFGTSTITVRVTDADFTIEEKTFTITVTSVNDAPTLVSLDDVEISEDAAELIIPLEGIGPGGGASESSQVIDIIPSNDMQELFEIFNEDYTNPASTGSLRIKTKPNAYGTVLVTVRVQDDGPGTPAPNVNFTTRTFTLQINSVNDLPAFVSEPVDEAEPGKPYLYSIEVIDVDGDAITLAAPVKPDWLTFTLGTNGQATLSGTPDLGTSGDFAVEITATDPTGQIVTTSFTINVNSRPIVSPITITLNEDEPHTFNDPDFAAGFADADSNPIAEVQITKLPIRGTLTFKGNAVNTGDKIPDAELTSLVFTPESNSIEPDTLRWNASDGFMLYSLSDTYAVMNIISLNDAPLITDMEPETDTLKYELGSEVPRQLTAIFDGNDPDGDNIKSAEIGFKRIGNYQYNPEKEVLTFQGTPKISGEFNEAAGSLILEGEATADEYKAVIRTIRYNYENVTDLSDTVNLRSVYVSMSDTKGATSLQSARIIRLIYTFSDLTIPSAFTPNVGDDVNQTWVISSPNGTEQYNDAELKIYNKRGILLYESRGFEKPWNGVWNGEVLPSDTYYYTIDLNYNRVRYKGTVTLLR